MRLIYRMVNLAKFYAPKTAAVKKKKSATSISSVCNKRIPGAAIGTDGWRKSTYT